MTYGYGYGYGYNNHIMTTTPDTTPSILSQPNTLLDKLDENAVNDEAKQRIVTELNLLSR